MNNEHRREFQEGREAFKANRGIPSCPYTPGTEQHIIWVDGYSSPYPDDDALSRRLRANAEMWAKMANTMSRDDDEDIDELGGKAGWPSTTGNPSGGGRDNNPPGRSMK